jgi:uncharacterized membrane protein
MQITSFPQDEGNTNEELVKTKVFHLIFPFILSLPLIALLALMLPPEEVSLFLTLLVAYVIPPAGKESIIPFGIILGYPWWMICSAILIIDAASALFITLNFHYLYRIPFFGEVFMRCSEGMQALLSRHRWISRFSLFGLFLFIFFPLQGSGAINGTILSRLLGIERCSAFICILAGSGLSCLAIAFGVTVIDEVSNHNLSVMIPILVLIIGISIVVTLYGAYGSRLR